MPKQDKEDLESRIDRLEKKVEELEHQIEAKSIYEQKQESAASAPASSEDIGQRSNPKKIDTFDWESSNIQAGEQWLNRIGIGLLLIGVAFLFKYSIDQGWLIPPVRSAIGLGIGVILSAVGLQMKPEEKPLKQILLGGGIAVFYITGFATFQLYTFIPSSIIWAFMVIVTLLSLSLSMRQNEAVLSVVGTLGALGTPFMLYSDEGSVVMLMAYTILILVATIIIYMQKGWKSLLWSIALGGALVIFVGLVNTAYYEDSPPLLDYWSLQAGMVVWMLGAWVLPVIREQLRKHNKSRWLNPSKKHAKAQVEGFSISSSIHVIAFLVPLLMLIMTVSLWQLSMNEAGLGAIILAVAGSLLYLPLTRYGLSKLASTHVLLGLCMLTIGFVLILEGNFLIVVIATEAVALRFVAWQINDARISASSHLLFLLAFFWLLNTLYYDVGVAETFLNIKTATQLGVILAAGLVVPRWLQKRDPRQLYKVTSHVLFLLWLYQKSMVFDNGQGWVTIAWGVYAILLLIWGAVQHNKGVRIVGMGTIFLVVGKLFLIDLSQLEAIWRILLFIGFGAVFLVLGYYWQSKWNTEEEFRT